MSLLCAMSPPRNARRVLQPWRGSQSNGGIHATDSGVLPVCHLNDVNLTKAVG